MDQESNSVQVIRQLLDFKCEDKARLIERLELLNFVSNAVVSAFHR